MGDKKTFYAKLFSYLLNMLNKYYTSGAIPFEERKEYEFVTGFHKDLEGVLELGQCRLTSEIFRLLCGTVQCRQLPFCQDPKGMLSEIWKIFSYWFSKPYDAKLQGEIMDTINAFTVKWRESDIAVELILAFASEVEIQNKQKAVA